MLDPDVLRLEKFQQADKGGDQGIPALALNQVEKAQAGSALEDGQHARDAFIDGYFSFDNAMNKGVGNGLQHLLVDTEKLEEGHRANARVISGLPCRTLAQVDAAAGEFPDAQPVGDLVGADFVLALPASATGSARGSRSCALIFIKVAAIKTKSPACSRSRRRICSRNPRYWVVMWAIGIS